ncbi:outer membrane protein [Bradyrhizobium sp. 2TAF24]|uniref:outer membrane protein n=1 Tax=Bradyrhizobium sp. 2TAF24 TaxID=3233011 RepID=UPI003F923925
MVRALEARVGVLEAENQRYRQQAENSQRVQRIEVPQRAAIAAARPPSQLPLDSYTSLKAKPLLGDPADDRWSGLYWGVSFGGGATRGAVRSQETYMSGSPLNTPPYNVMGSTLTSTSGPTTGYGALTDVFLGFNTRITPDLVVGLQAEGSMSDLNFSSSGLANYQYFNSAGLTGETASNDFRPNVHLRWMASMLARVGFLATPETLVYGIGGWTVGGFNYQNLINTTFYAPPDQFIANGPSVGAGLERKIDSNWSLRAEYRYTYFLPADVRSNFNFASSLPGVQSETVNGRFENSMHVGRIGVAYSMPAGR